MFEYLVDEMPTCFILCPNCEKLYKFTDLNGFSIPLLLQCAHTCCENCIRESIENNGYILCRKCGMKSSPKFAIDKVLNNVRESFPVAEQLIAKVNEFQKRKTVDESQIAFATNNKIPQRSIMKFCEECNEKFPECLCKECETFLCNFCFIRIHSSKTLKNHHMLSISSQTDLSKFPNTSQCGNYSLNNMEIMDKMREIHEKSLKKLVRVENSLKVLSDEHVSEDIKKNSLDFQNLFQKLTDYFIHIQNTVELLNKNVMQEYFYVQNSLDGSIRNCEKKLKELHKHLKTMIKDTWSIINANPCSKDFSELLEESEIYLNLPETVISKYPVLPDKPIEFSFNWIKMMKEECNFNFGCGGEVRLINSVDSWENNTDEFIDSHPNINLIFASSCNQSEISDDRSVRSHDIVSNIRVQSSLNSRISNRRFSNVDEASLNYRMNSVYNVQSAADIHLNSARNSVPKSRFSKEEQYESFENSKNLSRSVNNLAQRTRKYNRLIFKPGDTLYDVHISYIESPSHFYVQLNNTYMDLARYQKLFLQATHFPKVTLCELDKTQIYLALCPDNMWYRVRVVDFCNRTDENLSTLIVILVDVGKQEKISIEHMRKIDSLQKSIMLERELAIACCLFECFPINRATWNENDIASFEKYASHNKINMYIHKIQPSRLEVDLKYYKDGNEISIREFFIYSDRARYCSINQNIVPLSVYKDCKFFWDKDFQIGEWIDVQVSHINDPSDFYIRRTGSERCKKSFNDITNRLNSYFKVKNNYIKYTIQNPIVGLAVAAKFTDDNRWYRAQIIGQQTRNMFEVRYVDFGNTELLHIRRICGLPQEFFRITVQAVRCGLKDVEAPAGKWLPKGIKYFVNCVENKILKMVVQEQKNGMLYVALFENADTKNVKCINEDLIENGFAKGIGANVSIKPLPEKIQSQTKITKSISSSSSSEIDDEERIKESKSVDENTDLTRPSEMRFQVNIINCISPNMIYFSLTDQYIANMRLMNSMMNFYRDEKNNKDCIIDLVSEKMKCAVYIEKDKKWYRGVVLKVIDCKMTKIFLSDTAEEVIISLENLRTLPEQFVKEVDCALRCSLANVEYKEKWPLEICEMLKKKLKNYEEMYIVRKDCKENALIVELWGKNVVCKGPLEPAIVEWTNINKLLMENENLEDEQNEAKDYKPPIVENLKLFELESALKNSKDHVTEWLQSNIVEARSKGIEYELLIEKSHFSHEKNKLKELESGGMSVVEKEQVDTNIESVSIIEENEDWLPPIPLKETNFIGMPTYVNSDFNVYVQISGSNNNLLNVISNGLESRYQNSHPLPSDMHWLPNQICIAWFFLDKKWYRGKVKEVDITKNLVLVEYVDFGNTEWVKPKYLRKNISFKDIPLQCYKFPILSDCVSSYPDKKWPVSVLEFVHVTVVEKICEIKLRREKNEDFYRIEKLIIPQKFDLFDLLCQLNHATFSTLPYKMNKIKENKLVNNKKKIPENISVILPVMEVDEDKTDNDSTVTSSISAIENIDNTENGLINLKAFQINKTNSIDSCITIQVTENNESTISDFYLQNNMGILTVQVTEILSLNEIVINIIDCDADASIFEKRKEFLEMCSELQTEAVKQPSLEPPYYGRMCCTKFEDNNWYRALVIGKDFDNAVSVPVYYIDYGNVSTVKVSRLQQLKPSWCHIPAQGIKCTIKSIVLPKEMTVIEKLLEKMSEMLLSKEFQASIEIVSSKNKKYNIQLMNNDGTAPYQSVIDTVYN